MNVILSYPQLEECLNYVFGINEYLPPSKLSGTHMRVQRPLLQELGRDNERDHRLQDRRREQRHALDDASRGLERRDDAVGGRAIAGARRFELSRLDAWLWREGVRSCTARCGGGAADGRATLAGVGTTQERVGKGPVGNGGSDDVDPMTHEF